MKRKPKNLAIRSGAPVGEKSGRQSPSRTQTARAILPYVDPNSAVCMKMDPNRLDPAIARSLGLSASSTLPGCALASVGSYETYRQMSRDPTLALAIAAANAPIMGASWGFEAKQGVPDEWVQLIKDQFEPRRPFIVGECLRSREFGWRGIEKVFETSGPVTVYRKLKPLYPDRTTILIEEETGDFAGFRQDEVTLEPQRCFLYTHALDCDDYYGHALHENALRAWSNWLATIDNAGRLQSKVSGIIVQIHYPKGENETEAKDNRDIAQGVLNSIAAGKSVAMPNLFYAGQGIANMAELAGKSMWVLSTLDTGNQQGAQATMDGDRKYWDVQKLRGWLVPERAATEGVFGTKAEAEAHADILLSVAEQEHGRITRAVNCGLIDDLLVYNKGEAARGSVFATPQPIVDEAKEVLKQFLVALWTDPATLELLLGGDDSLKPVDVDAILDQFRFPRTDMARKLIRPIVSAVNNNGNGKVPPAIDQRISGMYRDANAGLEN